MHLHELALKKNVPIFNHLFKFVLAVVDDTIREE